MTARLAATIALLFTTTASADPAAWRIEGPAGGTLTLLGSMHYLRDRDHPLPDLVDRLYAAADRVVMELDLDDIDPAELQGGFLAAATLPASEHLTDVLPQPLYAQARERAAALGIDLSLLDRFEPWFVAVTLLDAGMARLGYRADRGVEQYLLGLAARDGKQVTGLETIAAQISAFDRLSRQDQSALLEQTIDELDSAEAVMGAMVSAWREGKLAALADSLMADFNGFPDLYASLVVDRNAHWAEALKMMLAERQDTLVVVGALHLVGANNLIGMLEASGYEAVPAD